MTEQELMALAEEFDTFFVVMCIKHKLSGLDFSAVCLARLSKLSKEIGYDANYQKMMVNVGAITAVSELNQQGNVVH